MQYPPNFTFEELTRSQVASSNNIDNIPTDEDVLTNLIALAWFLQGLKNALMAHFGENVKVRVGSGYRCLDLNSHQDIRGSKTSRHMNGLAGDVTCSHLSPFRLAEFVENHPEIEFEKMINEFGRWVHFGISLTSSNKIVYTAVKVKRKTKYIEGLKVGEIRGFK